MHLSTRLNCKLLSILGIAISGGIHHNKNRNGGKVTKLTEKMSMQISLSQIFINKDLHANTQIHLNMYGIFQVTQYHLWFIPLREIPAAYHHNNLGVYSKFVWIAILFQYQNVATLFQQFVPKCTHSIINHKNCSLGYVMAHQLSILHAWQQFKCGLSLKYH